jgi:hypothetical protein
MSKAEVLEALRGLTGVPEGRGGLAVKATLSETKPTHPDSLQGGNSDGV